jgi:bacterioferritin (cytochrome b1)
MVVETTRLTLVGEEEHTDWLEAQLTLIELVGEAHYMAQQIRDE